ncbi:MAG: Dabb family protein [Gemmatimonadota bacterium]
MIHHLVLIRFKPGTPQVQIDAAGQALVGLKGIVPEIHQVQWATNLAPSAAEYPWVLSVQLDDMAAVKRYLEHPTHVAVVERLLVPIREARLAIDFEVA